MPVQTEPLEVGPRREALILAELPFSSGEALYFRFCYVGIITDRSSPVENVVSIIILHLRQ